MMKRYYLQRLLLCSGVCGIVLAALGAEHWILYATALTYGLSFAWQPVLSLCEAKFETDRSKVELLVLVMMSAYCAAVALAANALIAVTPLALSACIATMFETWKYRTSQFGGTLA